MTYLSGALTTVLPEIQKFAPEIGKLDLQGFDKEVYNIINNRINESGKVFS